MSARDEHEPVVGTFGHGSITLTAYPSSSRVRVEARADNSVMDWSDLFEFVDQIRKPRTITTAEELDALPCGSVFRDDNERIWEVEKIGYGGVEKALSAMGIGSMLAFGAFRNFPATVLHEAQS